MGGGYKEYGGGAATGLSNDFISSLQSILKGGGQNGAMDAVGKSNPVASTKGFAGNVNKFINGDFGGGDYQVDTSQLKAQAGDGFKFDEFNPQTVDFSKFDNSGLKGFKSSVSGGPLDTDLANNPLFKDSLSTLKTFTGGSSPIGQAAPGFGIASYGSPGVDAATKLLERNKAKNVADLRARFGADGGMSFGTPAAYAEGNFLAEADAQNANTIANLARSDAALDLERALGVGQINAQNYKSFADNSSSIFNTKAGAASNLVGNVGDLIKAGGNLGLGARGQDIDAALGSGKLNLEALSAATGYDLDALKAASAQGISIGELINQNQGMRANNQAQNKGLNIEALSKVLGFDLEGKSLGENARQFNTSQQGDFIRNIMNIMAELSGKGIAQRQGVMKPSFGSQLVKGVTGLATAAAPMLGPGGFLAGQAVSRLAPQEIKAYSEGGTVPGTGNSDTQPAMLTPGEVVLNKRAVKLLGEDFLNKLNTLTAAKPKKSGKSTMPHVDMSALAGAF